MGTDTDTTLIKQKAKGFDLMASVLKALLPMLIVGGIGGGVAAGGIAVATPNIPVPNGVAKEEALIELRSEMRANSAAQAIQFADLAATLRAVMQRLDRIESRQDRDGK